jgi:hypothetical protein
MDTSTLSGVPFPLGGPGASSYAPQASSQQGMNAWPYQQQQQDYHQPSIHAVLEQLMVQQAQQQQQLLQIQQMQQAHQQQQQQQAPQQQQQAQQQQRAPSTPDDYSPKPWETDSPPQRKSESTPESAHKRHRQHQHQRGDEQSVGDDDDSVRPVGPTPGSASK